MNSSNAESENSISNLSKCKKITFAVFALLYTLLIGIIEIVSCRHSIDQLIFGWLLGIWIAFSYHVFLSRVINDHVRDLLAKRANSPLKLYTLFAFGIYVAT